MAEAHTVQGHSELVEQFDLFLRNFKHEDVLELASRYPSDQMTIEVDWHNDLAVFSDSLAEEFVSNPDAIQSAMDEALRRYDLPADISLDRASVRVTNVGYESNVRDVGEYGHRDIGEVIPIRGQINQTTGKQPGVEDAAFECQLCGTITRVPQYVTDLEEPHECQGCERKGPFRLNVDQSQFVDRQYIRMQLPPERADGNASEHIDIKLEDDLVNTATPGDRVQVAAKLDVDMEEKRFEAKAIDVELEETDFEDIETSEYEEEIHKVAANDPYQKIIDSIAPSIYGYDTIKLGIALQLFGGTRKVRADGSRERGDSHIFLVGDPGTAKSELLDFAHRLAPRSIFTDGKGSTSAGLTASAVRDDFGGSEWTIKGGTLVQADKGLACVDELDDMDTEDRSALNTALENQQISVSKAGINATMPARTTLLAAANPQYGRFDHYEPISKQIDIHPALLSRFDLIFVMIDDHDEETDRDIIRHKTTGSRVAQLRAANESVPDADERAVLATLDEDFMRAYIAYAKREVTPILTDVAEEKINEERLALRRLNDKQDDIDDAENAVPVTLRKHEAMVRLAEASARMCLSDAVEPEDVDRAMKLILRTMRDVEMDPDTGEYDADIVETGSSKSQDQRIKFVLAMIDELEDDTPYGCSLTTLLNTSTTGT